VNIEQAKEFAMSLSQVGSASFVKPSRLPGLLFFVLISMALAADVGAQEVRYYPVPRGAHPHDVAPAPDGTVWYTA
jgi:streptogramin lyase